MIRTVTIHEGESFLCHLRDPNLKKLIVVVEGAKNGLAEYHIIPTPLSPKMIECISPYDFSVQQKLCRHFFVTFKYNNNVKVFQEWWPV